MNILFVCTGNTCRSPMAEGIFKDLLKKNNIYDINVSSVGITASPGEHANEKAREALKEKGIDISGHRAKQLSGEIMTADLILTMTTAHKALVEAYLFRSSEEGKVFTLKEFASKISGEELLAKDIEDPYGRNYSFYKKSRDEIERELIKIIKNISKLEEI